MKKKENELNVLLPAHVTEEAVSVLRNGGKINIFGESKNKRKYKIVTIKIEDSEMVMKSIKKEGRVKVRRISSIVGKRLKEKVKA